MIHRLAAAALFAASLAACEPTSGDGGDLVDNQPAAPRPCVNAFADDPIAKLIERPGETDPAELAGANRDKLESLAEFGRAQGRLNTEPRERAACHALAVRADFFLAQAEAGDPDAYQARLAKVADSAGAGWSACVDATSPGEAAASHHCAAIALHRRFVPASRLASVLGQQIDAAPRDWSAIEASLSRIEEQVSQNWPAYDRDLAELSGQDPNSDVAIAFKQSAACDIVVEAQPFGFQMQANQTDAAVITYTAATAAAADSLDLTTPETAGCATEPDTPACQLARSEALLLLCQRRANR